MVEAVNDTRRDDKVLDSMNNNYITLIPNVYKTNNFNEYRTISLCNLLYKFDSKIVANRIVDASFV